MFESQSKISPTFTHRVEVLADSEHTHAGNTDRLTTLLLEFPRVVNSELLRHRSFSFNSTSSRAMRVETMIDYVLSNPYLPTVFQKAAKGMVAWKNLDTDDQAYAKELINSSYHDAIFTVQRLANMGVSKQVANRYLEPYAGVKVVVTGSWRAWELFLALRRATDADPVIQELAELVADALFTNKPAVLQPGDWHIPYSYRMDHIAPLWNRVYTSVASIARVSYDKSATESTIDKDQQLYNFLLEKRHLSVFEHQCCVADNTQTNTMNGNLSTHWIQLRKTLEIGMDMYDKFHKEL